MSLATDDNDDNRSHDFHEVVESGLDEDDRQPILDAYSSNDLSASSIIITRTSSQPSSDPTPSMAQTTTSHRYEGYQSKTLSKDRQHKRYQILPKFPTADGLAESSTHILLTNVPSLSLSFEERNRRDHGCDDFICYENSTHSPSTQQETHVLYVHFIRLSKLWHAPISLLVFNYELMVSSMFHLSLHEFVDKVSSLAWTIDEWKLALEVYLQMDVDCFYWKTCSFRGSQPRSMDYITYSENEGVFCMDPVEARYGMKRCHYRNCLFCHRPDLTHRYEPALKYTNCQIHTFVNHYQVILNCDVTCFSSHVIYTLTCPCQHYEYIGRTKSSFYKRLYYHRLQCSRIIRESLLGKSIVHRMGQPPSSLASDRIIDSDSMDLYRHIVHCYSALQVFLNYHFVYWCLVPMTDTAADLDDQLPMKDDGSNFLLHQFKEAKYNQPEATGSVRSDDDVQWCMDHLPLPPIHYRFSKRQRREHYYFFKAKLDLWPLSQHLDIYNATIVMALPHDSSSLLLQFVQALLVTHTECQLNSTTAQFPSHFDRALHWCEHLKRPSHK